MSRWRIQIKSLHHKLKTTINYRQLNFFRFPWIWGLRSTRETLKILGRDRYRQECQTVRMNTNSPTNKNISHADVVSAVLQNRDTRKLAHSHRRRPSRASWICTCRKFIDNTTTYLIVLKQVHLNYYNIYTHAVIFFLTTTTIQHWNISHTSAGVNIWCQV